MLSFQNAFRHGFFPKKPRQAYSKISIYKFTLMLNNKNPPKGLPFPKKTVNDFTDRKLTVNDGKTKRFPLARNSFLCYSKDASKKTRQTMIFFILLSDFVGVISHDSGKKYLYSAQWNMHIPQRRLFAIVSSNVTHQHSDRRKSILLSAVRTGGKNE